VNDLEPYICLAENCSQPDEIYPHSDAWISHLHQHTQHWRCSSHQELGLFSIRQDYIQHMRDAHMLNLPDTKVRALAKRNARGTVELFQSCPLCGSDEDGDGRRLLEHITGHLRSLALFSLPSSQNEVLEEFEGQGCSTSDSNCLTGDKLEDLDDEIPASSMDVGILENTKPESKNFLGGLHHDCYIDYKDVLDSSLKIDASRSRSATEGLEKDPILQSMLQRQKADLMISGQNRGSDLENFLRVVPKIYWSNPDGTLGPTVEADYVSLDYTFMDELLHLSEISATFLVHLVTEHGERISAAAKTMQGIHITKSKFADECNRLRTLRHTHIQAVLGSYSISRPGKDPDYGIVLFPANTRDLQQFLKGISAHNKHQSLTWSPHHDAHKLLPYFACLANAVLFLHQRRHPISHGNIKPGSIIVDESDNVILAEFGIIKPRTAISYGGSEGTITYSQDDIWHTLKEDSLQAEGQMFTWDVVSLGFVFLEMATVLFGKTLEEMRAPLRGRSKSGIIQVNYTERIGEIKEWLDVLSHTAVSTPWRVSGQLLHLNRAEKVLRAIEEMVSPQQYPHDSLEHVCKAFEGFSAHCP